MKLFLPLFFLLIHTSSTKISETKDLSTVEVRISHTRWCVFLNRNDSSCTQWAHWLNSHFSHPGKYCAVYFTTVRLIIFSSDFDCLMARLTVVRTCMCVHISVCVTDHTYYARIHSVTANVALPILISCLWTKPSAVSHTICSSESCISSCCLLFLYCINHKLRQPRHSIITS